jgi:hypothetical protein
VSSAGCNPVASRCGGSTPPVRIALGTKLNRRAPRLQRGRCRFESDRLHQSLRSVNGKHAPFVRPRCGFDSCRRLHADVAQREEHRSATPGRPVRSGPSAPIGGLAEMPSEPPGRAVRPEAASSVGPIAIHYWASLRPCLGTAIAPRRRAASRQTLLGPWCNRGAWRAPTSPVRVRILAGLLVAGRSVRLSGKSGSTPQRFNSASRSHRHDRDVSSAGRSCRVIDANRVTPGGAITTADQANLKGGTRCRT